MVDRTDELKSRVEAKRAEVEAELKRKRADAQGATNDQIEALERKLGELDANLKEGWDNLSQEVVERLNRWLK
jgi:LPS O-antigen subunit length determinant protein (WzzB/FepE family)